MIVNYDIVVPTIVRPQLKQLLTSLARAQGPMPGRIFIVDDRKGRMAFLNTVIPPRLLSRVRVITGKGGGPASARNVGWRSSDAEWIAFLDDDVIVGPHWFAELARDLATLDHRVAGSQGRVHVPLPHDRLPTDWERNVAGLENGRWITADMAYRRGALRELGGFDERFPRAFREDADLALRALRAGYRLVRGQREVDHPVRDADPWVSVRLQRGNADDALMNRLHGRDWRNVAGAPNGAYRRHVFATAAVVASVTAALCDSPQLAIASALTFAALTADFAWRRIAPGPKTPAEILTMAATSALIPLAAVYHRSAASLRLRLGSAA